MYKLIKALRTCYHLSFPFAILFVLAANLRLGTIRSGGFTLKHLKKHGVIEHDASITRYNERSREFHILPDQSHVAFFLVTFLILLILNEQRGGQPQPTVRTGG
jgi:hypothetical protein